MKRNVGGERDLDHIIHAALRGMDRGMLEYGVRAGLIFCLAREFEAGPLDKDLADAFTKSVRSVLGVWDAGTFFPRIVDPAGREEPGRCKRCEVAEACLRGDSGARLRLFEWSERREDLAPEEAALLEVWRLAAKAARIEERPGEKSGGPKDEEGAE